MYSIIALSKCFALGQKANTKIIKLNFSCLETFNLKRKMEMDSIWPNYRNVKVAFHYPCTIAMETILHSLS